MLRHGPAFPGIAEFPGHVKDTFLHGQVEQRAGNSRVDLLRQPKPDVVSAGRTDPVNAADRREELVGGPQNGIDLLPVLGAEPEEVRVEEPHFQQRGHQHLVEVRGAEVEVSFGAEDRFDQLGRQDPPTDPNTRRIRLREAPRQNHPVTLGIERSEARDVVAIVAELPVGGVLDNVDRSGGRPASGELDQGLPAFSGDRHTAWVVVGRAHVYRLHPAQLAGLFQPGQLAFDCLGNQSMLVDFDPDGPRAKIAQGPQHDEIAWRPADHNVARIEQNIAHQVEQLVAAGSNYDLTRTEVHFGGGATVGLQHAMQDRLAQGWIADRGTVLQRNPGSLRVRPDRLQGLAGGVDGQGLVVDESGSQRDQLGVSQGLGHQQIGDRLAPGPTRSPAKTILVGHGLRGLRLGLQTDSTRQHRVTWLSESRSVGDGPLCPPVDLQPATETGYDKIISRSTVLGWTRACRAKPAQATRSSRWRVTCGAGCLVGGGSA